MKFRTAGSVGGVSGILLWVNGTTSVATPDFKRLRIGGAIREPWKCDLAIICVVSLAGTTSASALSG